MGKSEDGWMDGAVWTGPGRVAVGHSSFVFVGREARTLSRWGHDEGGLKVVKKYIAHHKELQPPWLATKQQRASVGESGVQPTSALGLDGPRLIFASVHDHRGLAPPRMSG